MFRYKTTAWISTTLLLMTYGVFGWLYASWITKMMEDETISQGLLQSQNSTIVYGVGTIWVLLIAIVFTTPVALMTISLNSWLKSEMRAFFSIFFGALAFAIIVQWLDYFARFFVLLASAILVKLDLQALGLNIWLSQLLLAVMSLGSFWSGIVAFNYWG
ncbi:MAG: hypothetical protein QNJ70_21045 [Xenococcaceae cyanobacterium MO_207.B15]|nr:hypothetical protein [Xenococcaceae cyanobacterium MO_207.B15]